MPSPSNGGPGLRPGRGGSRARFLGQLLCGTGVKTGHLGARWVPGASSEGRSGLVPGFEPRFIALGSKRVHGAQPEGRGVLEAGLSGPRSRCRRGLTRKARDPRRFRVKPPPGGHARRPQGLDPAPTSPHRCPVRTTHPALSGPRIRSAITSPRRCSVLNNPPSPERLPRPDPASEGKAGRPWRANFLDLHGVEMA
jgi:hypothetical protein